MCVSEIAADKLQLIVWLKSAICSIVDYYLLFGLWRMSSHVQNRNARVNLAAKMINMVKSIGSNCVVENLTSHELAATESCLREELGRNQWLFNLFNAIIYDSCLVDSHELKLYSGSGSLSVFCPDQIESIRSEIAYLQNKNSHLRCQISLLEEVFRNLRDTKRKPTGKELKCQDKLQRVVYELKDKLSSKSSAAKDPVDVANEIMNSLNTRCCAAENGNSQVSLDKVIDDLTLTTDGTEASIARVKNEAIDKLHALRSQLLQIHKTCYQIKCIYMNMKNECIVRKDFRQLIDEIDSNKVKVIERDEELSQLKSNEFALNPLLMKEFKDDVDFEIEALKLKSAQKSDAI